jgi:hypothetical protein
MIFSSPEPKGQVSYSHHLARCNQLITLYVILFQLVKLQRAHTHRAAQRIPGWRIGGALSLRLSGYNTASLTVDSIE